MQRRKLEELNLMDDFLFNAMSNPSGDWRKIYTHNFEAVV